MITPYLTFSGECKDAMAFYEEAFATKGTMLQLYESYVPEGLECLPDDLGQWVLHGEMEIAGVRVWFADETAKLSKGNNIKLSVTVDTAAVAAGIFERLSQGAEITLPPTETFYSAFHAGLTDKFGVSWNVVAEEGPE